MDNIRFIKRILMEGHEYWIAKKATHIHTHVTNRTDVSIWIICIPFIDGLLLPKKEDEILLKDVERLWYVELHNIPLSDKYPPFQSGITLADFYDGFPITKNINEVMKKALLIGTNELYDYEHLFKEETQPELTHA